MIKYVIYCNSLGTIKGTTLENYITRVQDTKLIHTFLDFDTVEEVKNYVIQYFGYAENELKIIC